jgi:hypothetical protein
MSRITTREDFRNYILSELGSPQIHVELTTTQLDEAVDEAVDMITRHLYGEANVFKLIPMPIVSGQAVYDFKHLLASESIDSATNVMYQRVVNVIDLETGPGGSLGHTVNYTNSPLNQVMNDLVYSGSSGGTNTSQMMMVNYETGMQYLDMTLDMLGGKHYGNFDILTQELSIVPTPQHDGTGVITVYQKGDVIDIYNHIHTKRYAFFKALSVWGRVLSKYQGMSLPDGTVVDGNSKREEGQTEVKALVEILRGESEQPIFAIG